MQKLFTIWLLAAGLAAAQTTTVPLTVTVTPTGTTVSLPTTTVPLASCPGQPPPPTTQTMTCPAGTTGSWVQTTTYVSAPAPKCWSAVLSAMPAGACTPVVGGTVARPSYNTGTGSFVLNGRLYDANGNEFRIRGVNKAHWDQDSNAGLVLAHANALRMFIDTTQPLANNIKMIQGYINSKIIPLPTYNGTGAGQIVTSCNQTSGALTTGVNAWVSQAASWTTLNKWIIINIANEWGPSNSTTWRDSYINAVAKLRAAGYLGTLLVDSGGCGQDMQDLTQYAAAVLAADPQHNVIFAFHSYGATTSANVGALYATLGGLRAQGVVVAIMEFGPGRNIGPSPTSVTPGQVILAAEANQLGWAAWAWDDNNQGACRSDDNWFDMTYFCGVYSTPADLTIFGKDVVLNPTYGLSVLAHPASIF
jgi:mannan endo-1,4-beta-mannosidase